MRNDSQTKIIGLVLMAVVSSLGAQDSKFVTSSGKAFVPREFYPEFSWDTVPLYMMFADDHRLLSDDEVKRISASSSFICIEKQHGAKKLGAAELGAKHETARFKKVNPGGKSLCYFNSAYAYPFTSYARRFARGKVKDEDKKLLIRDPGTGGLANRRGIYFFDVLNPELRKWWSDTAGLMVKETGADGLFVDQMHGFVWLRKDKRAEVAKAQAAMLRMTKKAIGKDKILLLNNAGHIPALLEIGDAFMFEHCNPKMDCTKEAIVSDWAVMKKIAEHGKIAVYRFGADPGGTPLANSSRTAQIEDKDRKFEKLSKDQLDFYLACYLIGAQPYSYFQYGWGWSLTTGPLTDYPQFKKPLGAPLGEYKRESPRDWVFTREFDHASVWLDLQRREGKITWK